MPDPTDPSRTVDLPSDRNPSGASGPDETAGLLSRTGAPHDPGFAPPAAPGEVGALGPYRVVKQLGRGGMGAVYLAVDTRLNRKLALKVMLPEFAADAGARERFLREARAAALVAHDNVVTVFEADERDGIPYIAMQFLQGYPLDEYLNTRGAPPLPHVLRIARETALGLSAAHALGLVHRDIKPANLWLEAPNGRVKVLDFGLARPVDADAELTRSGAVLGTPAYMSPEQAEGEKVDHRTDLFSLGTVLYRLCAGTNPFTGRTVMAVLMALGNKEPTPVRELNPNVPEALAALVHQLLAKRPDDRPQTATEVARRLRAILDELLAVPLASAALPPGAADLSTSMPVVVHPVPAQPPLVAQMYITAQPESAFANLGDDDATHVETAPEAPKPERKTSGGKGALIAAAGGLLLAAVAVAGVVVVITNKSRTEPETKAPDGAPAVVKAKDGKPLAPVKPVVAPDPDRKAAEAVKNTPDYKAAEYVLSVGGTARLNAGVIPRSVAALPLTVFQLERADLERNKQVDDAGLAAFKECPSVQRVHLDETNTGDVGLKHFHECAKLHTITLKKTNVTADGIEAFRKARPRCRIEWDGGTIEPNIK